MVPATHLGASYEQQNYWPLASGPLHIALFSTKRKSGISRLLTRFLTFADLQTFFRIQHHETKWQKSKAFRQTLFPYDTNARLGSPSTRKRNSRPPPRPGVLWVDTFDIYCFVYRESKSVTAQSNPVATAAAQVVMRSRTLNFRCIFISRALKGETNPRSAKNWKKDETAILTEGQPSAIIQNSAGLRGTRE